MGREVRDLLVRATPERIAAEAEDNAAAGIVIDLETG
jgi:hypothetical protein